MMPMSGDVEHGARARPSARTGERTPSCEMIGGRTSSDREAQGGIPPRRAWITRATSFVAVAVLAIGLCTSCVRPDAPRFSVEDPAVDRAVPTDPAGPAPHHAALPPDTARIQRIEELGVTVECLTTPVSPGADPSAIYAGDDVEVRFRITDATTGSPLPNLNPAAWIHHRPLDAAETCADKVEAFLGGSISARAEYDLNVFYVLAMNDEPSITVVDPLFGYGGSRLLAMVRLPSPGEDWVLSADQTRLYVTMPLINQVAVIDTGTWEVIHRVDVAVAPTRIRLQPDGRHLWVSCVTPSTDRPQGVITVIDRENLNVRANLPIGNGHHDIAISSDSAYAYITNDETASVTVVDATTLEPVTTLTVGMGAAGVAYSPVSRCAYVVDGRGGAVVVIDGRTHAQVARIPAEPGLGCIRPTPDGRSIFVASTHTAAVHVIDVARNTIIQTADVGPEPEQIAFSLNLAYVRSKGSELILMIPLDQVGTGGRLSVVDFTGGHAPFGLAQHPSRADGIALAPSGLAMVVANPVDKSIYYYREGMAAPMGEFTNYGREPRAVMVVDRSLNEVETGVYGTTVKLDRPGKFDVVFLLDVPGIVHCFHLDVAHRPGADDDETQQKPIRIESMIPERRVTVGAPVKLRFAVTDTQSGQPRDGIDDLGILTFAPDGWQQRQWAESIDDGLYEATFTPPHAGVYYVFCRVPSAGLEYRDSTSLVLTASDRD